MGPSDDLGTSGPGSARRGDVDTTVSLQDAHIALLIRNHRCRRRWM
jgi:hypothetical protein